MSETFVIIGAGHAGGTAAATLRQQGFDGRLVVVGDETYPPYERPPLSKAFLADDLALERMFLKKPDYYEGKSIELMLATRVTRIDRAGRSLALSDGASLAYDKLLLATGGYVRRLNCPGSDLEGIHYLRTIEDVIGIKKALRPGARLVIVGGGYIGLEVAAVAIKKGVEVTVLEVQERCMNRVVAPVVSTFYQDQHRAAGVDIRLHTGVEGFEGDGSVREVVCADGSRVAADLVVVGIGILPATELAGEAGLAVDNGIVVDEFARTEDEHIFAAGDVTNHPNALLTRRLRLESVPNAISQAKTAASAMLGSLKPYVEIPWFWSDQFDLKLQIVGISDPDDDVVVRGDPGDRAFSVIYLRNGVVVAVNAINSLRDFMAAKKIVEAKLQLDPEMLADINMPMKDMI